MQNVQGPQAKPWDQVMREAGGGRGLYRRGGLTPFVNDSRRERRTARRAMARVVSVGRSVRVQEITTSSAATAWAVGQELAA